MTDSKAKDMEAQVKRFAAICEKYYEAADKTGGYPEIEMQWIIGLTFDDFSVFTDHTGIQVFLPRAGRMLCHSKSDGEVSMPSNITDYEFDYSCDVLEVNFGRVADEWKRAMDSQKSDSIARLEQQKKDIDEELQRLKALNP